MALEIFRIIFTINFIVLQMVCLIQRNVSSKIGTDPGSDTPSEATLPFVTLPLDENKTFIGFLHTTLCFTIFRTL